MRNPVFVTVAAIVAVLLLATPPAAASRPRPEPGDAAEITAADVRRVAARDVEPLEAYRILHRAADSGNRDLVEPLKAVVAAGAKESDHGLGMYLALHTLLQLGEPRAYFLGHLDRYRDHPWLAHDAIIVLGRDPDDELMERLKRIEADIRQREWDSRLSNALSAVQQTRDVIDAYRKLPDVAQRIDLLLKHAGSTWNPIRGMNSDPIDQGSPLPFWARKELQSLSAAHGPLIAQRLVQLDIGYGGYPDDTDRYVADARDYVAQFLPADVRKAYERLKRERGQS